MTISIFPPDNLTWNLERRLESNRGFPGLSGIPVFRDKKHLLFPVVRKRLSSCREKKKSHGHRQIHQSDIFLVEG